MAANKNEDDPFGFESYAEAFKTADKEYPPTPDLIRELRDNNNTPLETKEDVRFFVLFNMVKSIDEKLNNTTEDWFLRRIQHNILLAAEKYLK